MERTFWTDERLDNVIARIDTRFDAIDRKFERLEDRMDRGFTELRAEISATGRQLTQIGWALVGILLVQLIAAVVALS